MYVTFSEGPLPSILCPGAIQCVLEVLKVPMNLTNWVLVGSQSPNLAVQLHIRLKSEISVIFCFLKAVVDELPKETIQLTTGNLREADSLAPIYWDLCCRGWTRVCLSRGLEWVMYLMILMRRTAWIVCQAQGNPKAQGI